MPVMDNEAEVKEKVPVSIQIPKDVAEWIESGAEEGHRTRNAQIVMILQREFRRSAEGVAV